MIFIKCLFLTLLAIIAKSEKHSTNHSELPLSLLVLPAKETTHSEQYNDIQEYYNHYYESLFRKEKECTALIGNNPAYNPYHSSLLVNSKEANTITVLGDPIERNRKNANSENECGPIQNMSKQSISCRITLPNNTIRTVELTVPDNQCYDIIVRPIYTAKVNLWACNYNNSVEISKNITITKINNYISYWNLCGNKINHPLQITLDSAFNEKNKRYTLKFSEALTKGEYISSPGGRWHFGLLPNGELALCEDEFKESHIKWSNGINYWSKYDLKFFIDINGHLVVTAKNILETLGKNDYYNEKTNSITEENKLNKRIEEKDKDQISVNPVEGDDSVNNSDLLKNVSKFKEWLKNHKVPESKNKIPEIINVIQKKVIHKSDEEIIVWNSLPWNLTYNVGYFGDSGYSLVLLDNESNSKNSPIALYDGADIKIWQISPGDKYRGYPSPSKYDMSLIFETTTSSTNLAPTPAANDTPIYSNPTNTTATSINSSVNTKTDKISTKTHKNIYLPSQTQYSSSKTRFSIPTIMSSNKCGTYDDGIYVCKNNKCCSKYGHCGDTEKYCGKGCQNNYGLCYSKSGRCGIEYGRCKDNTCCSKYSYCGNGKKYCNDGCQSEFGMCM